MINTHNHHNQRWWNIMIALTLKLHHFCTIVQGESSLRLPVCFHGPATLPKWDHSKRYEFASSFGANSFHLGLIPIDRGVTIENNRVSSPSPILYLWTHPLFMLDEFICQFRGVGSILSFYSIFDKKSC